MYEMRCLGQQVKQDVEAIWGTMVRMHQQRSTPDALLESCQGKAMIVVICEGGRKGSLPLRAMMGNLLTFLTDKVVSEW